MLTVESYLLNTPCYLTCTIITEAGSLLTTPCYLTCTMITEAGSAQHTLLPKMYMITEAGSLLTKPCYLTCNITKETLTAVTMTVDCFIPKKSCVAPDLSHIQARDSNFTNMVQHILYYKCTNIFKLKKVLTMSCDRN